MKNTSGKFPKFKVSVKRSINSKRIPDKLILGKFTSKSEMIHFNSFNTEATAALLLVCDLREIRISAWSQSRNDLRTFPAASLEKSFCLTTPGKIECNLVRAAVRSLALSERIAKQIGASEEEKQSSAGMIRNCTKWEQGRGVRNVKWSIHAITSK